jgi:hypothetical protein
VGVVEDQAVGCFGHLFLPDDGVDPLVQVVLDDVGWEVAEDLRDLVHDPVDGALRHLVPPDPVGLLEHEVFGRVVGYRIPYGKVDVDERVEDPGGPGCVFGSLDFEVR